MDPLRVAHLVVLSSWAGVVLAEVVVELAARDPASRRQTAILHYWIDLLFELPILAGVLVTGAWLTVRQWPLTPLHWVKIAAGLGAVAANLACVLLVVLRKRRLDDDEALLRHGARVRRSALVGVPLAAVAAYVGFAYYL